MRLSIVPLLLLPACDFHAPDLVEEWTAEAAAHGDMGRAGSFSVTSTFASQDPDAVGSAFNVAGDVVVDGVDAPFLLSNPTLTLSGFERDGVVGLLQTTTALHIAGGRAEGFNASSFQTFDAGDGSAGVLNINVAAGLTVVDAVIDSGSFFFTPDDGSAPVEIVASAEAPVSFADVFFDGSSLSLSTTLGFTATVSDLALGGSAPVTVTLGGEEEVTGSAVFGRDIALTCAPSTCAGEGRITQAVLSGDEMLIEAEVEVAPYDAGFDDVPFSDDIELALVEGEARAVSFAFREKGFAGDAVVTTVEARGDAAEHITIVASPPPGPATTIIGLMLEDGDINVGEALVLAVAGPAIVVVDALISIGDFFSSSSDGPSPVPIPSWIQAGQVGTFAIVVDTAGLEEGDRLDATIVIGGANFAEQKVKFVLSVED